jgi:hypothetical protein
MHILTLLPHFSLLIITNLLFSISTSIFSIFITAELFLKDAPIFSFSNLKNGKSVRIPIGGIGNPKSNAGLAQDWNQRKSKVIWRG